MNYIVYDLELNSKPFKNKLPNEIIEIGAVKLDENLQYLGSFQSFVKPKIFSKLFPIPRKKTSIRQDDVNAAESLSDIITRFRRWIGEEYVLCYWGYDDIHHLIENCTLNNLSTNWISVGIDIQKHFSRLYGCPQGQTFSLKNALELAQITVTEDLHRAEVDARLASEIFAKIYNDIKFSL